jgi:hypothetical protein
VEKRAFDEGDIIVGDSDWIAWAKERAEALDPLRRGAAGMFDTISKVSQWSCGKSAIPTRAAGTQLIAHCHGSAVCVGG